ncbi:hypothetical protein BDK51DRAFT_34612 [Blyttiomyces helicus]|uniref:protein xylosyltransferase n=1 Tax=Blyttiomyces helicus TaxID=388810 RepID=A0A4P9W5X0_9FUNG|nr:hypothetical protein BDK51DRAFT_34612 [Blyttiomyces helicus]|eukprot:RKO87674.1 hypothetical protein BDK51DRAFT_34612 [Blyttiomyces helicus]
MHSCDGSGGNVCLTLSVSVYLRFQRLRVQPGVPQLIITSPATTHTSAPAETTIASATTLPASTTSISSSLPTPTPDPPRVLGHEATAALASAVQWRAFAATGFDFCSILDNATFDALVPIAPLGGSVAEVNPTKDEFARLIDREAKRAYDFLLKKNDSLDKVDVLRLACYMTAEGANVLSNITQTRLLVSLDPPSYFGNLIPSIFPPEPSTPSIIPSPRRHYPLAYLLMIHDLKKLLNYKLLIEQIDDGSAVILIHVDSRAPELKQTMSDWLKERDGDGPVENVFVARTSFQGSWGHASLVWMQLSGDWPLRTGWEIARILDSDKKRGMEFIEHPGDSAGRLVRPHLLRTNSSSVEYAMWHPAKAGLAFWPFPSFSMCKQYQWMILSRRAIEFLRSDPVALNILAFVEHTWIPDEAYFCLVFSNVPAFSQKVIPKAFRYLRFPGGKMHPAELDITESSRSDLAVESPDVDPRYFFLRKVVPVNVPDFIEWIRINHIDKHDWRSPEEKAAGRWRNATGVASLEVGDGHRLGSEDDEDDEVDDVDEDISPQSSRP